MMNNQKIQIEVEKVRNGWIVTTFYFPYDKDGNSKPPCLRSVYVNRDELEVEIFASLNELGDPK